MITREIADQLEMRMFKSKAIILLGARQVGKTTLINLMLEGKKGISLRLNGDDPTIVSILTRPNLEQIKQIIGRNKIVFIDEAQRIPQIGITSKLIVDNFPSVQLILSGSSSFELTQEMHEPLTGRKWTFRLWPISWREWEDHNGFVKSEQDLENRLVYGFYPDVLNHPEDSSTVLKELMESYLFKDVLMYGKLKKPVEIQKLLQALAYQVGNEVVLSEVAETVGLDPKTVSKYIDILEKAFVLFDLQPFNRNLRNEIKKNRKIYFIDNGIRNAIIGQLQAIPLRNDIDALWENFLISERHKLLSYRNSFANKYFWRTAQQQEIDYLEEKDNKITAWEFKWNEKRKKRFPKTFTETYASENHVIHRNNFRDFLEL